MGGGWCTKNGVAGCKIRAVAHRVHRHNLPPLWCFRSRRDYLVRKARSAGISTRLSLRRHVDFEPEVHIVLANGLDKHTECRFAVDHQDVIDRIVLVTIRNKDAIPIRLNRELRMGESNIEACQLRILRLLARADDDRPITAEVPYLHVGNDFELSAIGEIIKKMSSYRHHHTSRGLKRHIRFSLIARSPVRTEMPSVARLTTLKRVFVVFSSSDCGRERDKNISFLPATYFGFPFLKCLSTKTCVSFLPENRYYNKILA